jgi:hypothetical protein
MNLTIMIMTNQKSGDTLTRPPVINFEPLTFQQWCEEFNVSLLFNKHANHIEYESLLENA